MRIQVGERCLRITENEMLVAGSVLEYQVIFDFPEAWAGYTRTAVFKTAAGLIKEMLLVDDACVIPWEVLETSQYLQIGIYGVKDANVRPTLWAERQNVFPGAEQGDPVIRPETTPWAEALEAMDADAQSAQESATSAATSADRAEQAARDAGYMFFYIDEHGDLIYQRTSNVKVDFYLNNGDLYVKAVG